MEKNLTTMLADIRLDLSDAGAVWSNAELTRCVERAVGDLTRFLPRQQTYEVTVDAEVEDESFTTPAASDVDKFVVAQDISAIANGATSTLATQKPDVPRPVMITITDANTSITSFTIIVKGRDEDGFYIEESFFFEGGLVQTGVRYFAFITQVEVDEMTGEGAGDTLDVGTGSSAGVWVSLANKPIKPDTGTITSQTRDTDFIMDYVKGRIALKSGGGMSEATAYTIDYTKSNLHVDLSSLKDFIRVDRVEYPVGKIPQEYVTFEMQGKLLVIGGSSGGSQAEVSDESHILIHYLTSQSPPSAAAPGSYPNFLDNTVELASSAYALLIMIQKMLQEAEASQDLVETEVALANASFDLCAAEIALANSTLDGISYADIATLITAASTALTSAATNASTAATTAGLADITLTTTALANASTVLANVLTTSIDKATTGAEAYLDSGDDKILTLNTADRVAEKYREYAQARAELAQARIATALGYAQEAAQRIASMELTVGKANAYSRAAEAYIAQAGQNVAAANIKMLEQQARVAQAQGYLANSEHYAAVGQGYLADADRYRDSAAITLQLVDKYRLEATERRNEAWAIWKSPPEYAPMYTLVAGAQIKAD